MNYLKINNEVEKLNLKWQEYDFGDIVYAKVPTIFLSEQTNITSNCETEKYKIQFCQDGYTLIFKETEQASSIEKIIKTFSKIYASFKGEPDFHKSQQQVSNSSIVDVDL